MSSLCVRLGWAVQGSFVLLLAGCITQPPTLNGVTTQFDVVTRTKTIDTAALAAGEPQSNYWESHEHADLDVSACYDLEIAPDGVYRFLTFGHQTPSGDWRLVVITGLTASQWSEIPSAIAIEGPSVPFWDESHVDRCLRPRIEHLKDDLYGIVWVLEGNLHSALFDPTAQPGEELILTDVVEAGPGGADPYEGLRTTDVSFVYLNDEVHMVYPRPGRIQTRLGTVTEDSLDFDTFSTFFSVQYGQLSDAVAHDGMLYVATTRTNDEGANIARLWSKTPGAIEWAEVASCAGSGFSKLLFFDHEGEARLLRDNEIGNDGWLRLQRFSDCSGANIGWGIGISMPLVEYYPGG